MSYRTEENAIKWKIRRIRAIVISVIVVIVVAVCIFCAFVPPHTWPYYFYLPVVSARQEGELRMHFIDVGQGDCTLIELPDGKTMMIDGGNGEKDNSTAIIRYLKALNIGRLDYLVLTHVDSDHCGGLDDVMSYVSVGTIYYPEEPNAAINSEYAQFYEKLSGSSCEKEYNRQGIKLTSSSQSYAYEFVWIWPYGSDNPNADKWVSNEKSAVISLEYVGKKALFVGDAPSKTLQSLYVQAQYGLLPEGISLKDLDYIKSRITGRRTG